MFELRATTVAEMQAHAGDLLAEQWAELGRAGVPLEVCWPTYCAAEHAGILSILGAWSGATLAAYCASFVAPALYTAGRAWRVESCFVRRAWRGLWLGPRLIVRVQRMARECGCCWVAWEAPPGSRLSRLLAALGFNQAIAVHRWECV